MMSYLINTMFLVTAMATARFSPSETEPEITPKVTDDKSLRNRLVAEGYAAIPLWKTNTGCFVARVNVCDSDFFFAIDTGAANQLSIDPESFKRIKKKPDLIEAGFVKGVGSELVKCHTSLVEGMKFTDSTYMIGGQNILSVIPGISITAELFDPKTGKSVQKTIDGLVGQHFLNSESAILDQDTATLFLIQLNKKDGPKLLGHWRCTGGEKNGKPLADTKEKWIEIRDDGSVEFRLENPKKNGVAQLRKYEGNRLISVGKDDPKHKDRPIHLGGGRYTVEGDSLKLLFIEDDRKKFLEYFLKQTNLKFEAKADSGPIYYEFARKPK